jgi:hypothetical protein
MALNVCLAGATAMMVWAAFPPLHLGILAWIALVPLLVMAGRTTSRRAALWSGAAGYGLFLALLHCLRFVTYAGWVALALYCALYCRDLPYGRPPREGQASNVIFLRLRSPLSSNFSAVCQS